MLEKNIARACRAYAQLDGYPDVDDILGRTRTEDEVKDFCEDTEPQDMLTDIMHLCDLCGFEFESMLRMARNNYEAERDGEEDS